MEPTADRIVYALLDAGDRGLTRREIAHKLRISPASVDKGISAARRSAADVGALIPRSVWPGYRYRLLDKDNPDAPSYKASAKVDVKDITTRLDRTFLDAKLMADLLDPKTRDGRLARIIAKHVGRAVEDIAEAKAGL